MIMPMKNFDWVAAPTLYNKTSKQDMFSEIIYKRLNLKYKTNSYRDMIDRIVCLFQIQKLIEYIFPICEILFPHLPYGNTLSLHPLPCLNPHCTFSSGPFSFNQHSTI